MSLPETIDESAADVAPHRVARLSSSAGGALRHNVVEIAVSALLVVITFPTTLRPEPSLDSSWMAGLQMAAVRDFVFGQRIVFTFGPLGYLDNPALYVARPGILAVMTNVVLTFVLAFVTIRLLRRRFSVPTASVIAILIVVLIRSDPAADHVLVMLAVGWAIWWVLRDQHSLGPVVAMGVLFAPTVLMKFSCLECLIVLGVAVALAAFADGGIRTAARHGAAFIGAAVGSLVLAWMLAGQPPGDLLDWFNRSLEVAGGYSDAMGVPFESSRWIYPVGGVLLALALGAIWTARELSQRRRAEVVTVLLLAAVMSYKESYVRQIGSTYFFVGVIVALSLLPFFDRRLAFAALALALLPVLALKTDYDAMLDVPSHLSAIRTFKSFMTSSDYRRAFIRFTRDDASKVFGIPESMRTAMAGHSVDVQPISILAAYSDQRIRWEPSPVFQSYVAYTQSLDSMNARFISGRNAPDFVLREAGIAIDHKLARFESPAATLALMCHYRERSTGAWQLFARSTNRCGRSRALKHVETALGRTVPIPGPGSQDRIIIARFSGLASSFPDQLQSLTSRGVELWLGMDRWSRFLQGTQGSAHIVAIPECAREALDGPSPISASSFVMSDRAPKAFASTRRGDDDASGSHDSFSVDFSEIPFRC